MSDPTTPQDLVDFLNDDPDEIVGHATGMNADGTVNVLDDKGNNVNAIAATPCVSQPTLAQRVNGTWYAFQSPNQVTSENTLIRKRSRPISQNTYPIKILFYKITNGVKEFYIGGDRPVPRKINVPPLFNFHGFTNSGRCLNSWIAAFIKNNSYPYNENKPVTTYMLDGLGGVYENTPEIYGGASPQYTYRGNGPVIEYAFSFYPQVNFGDVINRTVLIQKYYYQDFYFWSSTLRNFLAYDYNINRKVNRNRTLAVSTFKDKSKSSGFGWTFNWIDEGIVYFGDETGSHPYNGNTIPKIWNTLESYVKPDFALQSGIVINGDLVHWNPLLNGKNNKTAIVLKSKYINADNKGLNFAKDLRDITSQAIDEKEYEFFFVDSNNNLLPIDKDVIFNFGFQSALNPLNTSQLKLSTSQDWAEYDSRTHYGTLVMNMLYKPIINNANNNQFNEDGNLDIKSYNFMSQTYTKRSANFCKIPPGSVIQKIAYYPA